MNKIEVCLRLGLAVLLLVAGATSARAGGCHELVGGGRYVCASNDAETTGFPLEFFADGELVILGDEGLVLGCSCSSLGDVDRPNVEGGRGIVCVDHASPGIAILFSARVQGRKLTQGTLANTGSGASEAIPFLCERVN